jgi:hypothetical protein
MCKQGNRVFPKMMMNPQNKSNMQDLADTGLSAIPGV